MLLSHCSTRTIVPRHLKLTSPNPAGVLSSLVLIRNVLGRILPVGDCPSIQDHPAVQVSAIVRASGDCSAVPVSALRLTPDYAPSNSVRQCQRSLLATTPPRLVWPRTLLPTFRRIDPEQPNSSSVHLQSVTVNHADNADECVTAMRCTGGKGTRNSSQCQGEKPSYIHTGIAHLKNLRP